MNSFTPVNAKMTIKGTKVYHWPVGANATLDIWNSQEQGEKKKREINKGGGGQVTVK